MAESITRDTLQLFQERPSVAVLMSGVGTNAIHLLGNDELRDLYDIRSIVTDTPTSNARNIAEQFKLPYTELAAEGPFLDIEQRNDYFNRLGHEMGAIGINAVFYAGFMKISSEAFTKEFPGVNVHPADLTIVGDDGLPLYRGMKAMDAMAEDLGYVRATVHIVDTPVDSGTSLALSQTLPTRSSESSKDLHNRLKNLEHTTYLEALVQIATGKVNESVLPIIIKSTTEEINP